MVKKKHSSFLKVEQSHKNLKIIIQAEQTTVTLPGPNRLSLASPKCPDLIGKECNFLKMPIFIKKVSTFVKDGGSDRSVNFSQKMPQDTSAQKLSYEPQVVP